MLKPLAVLATCVLSLLCAQTARADSEFTDPVGDASGSPDIAKVRVANDSGSRVAFRIELAGGATLPPAGDLTILVDADKDDFTGAGSWDYRIVLTGVETWSYSRWNGDDWILVPAVTGKAYFLDDAVVFAIDRSELGDTKGFDLFVQSGLYEDGELIAADPASDGEGEWTYQTVAKTLGLTATPIVAVTKGGARAGRAFLVGYTFGRTDSPEPAAGAKTTCVATISGKRLAARVNQSGEVAACLATPPSSAKGKLLRLTLKTIFGNVSIGKVYSTRVRA